jgi:hypothetical protein
MNDARRSSAPSSYEPPPKGGFTVCLWLIAVLLAQVEFFWYLLERMYVD